MLRVFQQNVHLLWSGKLTKWFIMGPVRFKFTRFWNFKMPPSIPLNTQNMTSRVLLFLHSEYVFLNSNWTPVHNNQDFVKNTINWAFDEFVATCSCLLITIFLILLNFSVWKNRLYGIYKKLCFFRVLLISSWQPLSQITPKTKHFSAILFLCFKHRAIGDRK